MQISSEEFFVGSRTNHVGLSSTPVSRTFNGRTKNVRMHGTNFIYGKWVVEDETFGTSTSALTTGERKFWFEIDNSSLNNIPFGTTIRYSLRISIVDSNNNEATSALISARLIRPYPKATLSFDNGSASPYTIDEGDEVEVKVTFDQFPRTPIDVTLASADIGKGQGFLGSFSTNPVSVGSSGVAKATYTAGIVDSHNVNGKLDLTIASNPNLVSTNSKLTLVVTNHSHPTLSITSTSDQSNIAEGDEFTIKLSAFPRPTKEISVNLVTSERVRAGGFLVPLLANPVIGPSGSTEIEVSTNTVISHEDDGNITISLGTSDYYEINSHLNQVSVSVTNTNNPVISIVDAPTTIMEGAAITFQLQANPAPVESLFIALNVTESLTNTGYLRNSSFDNPVTMTTSGLVDVSIDTNALLPSIGAGEISISIAEGKRYSPSLTNGTAQVAITKDSTAVIPEISIIFEGQQANVTEGEDLVFKLRATPSPIKPLYAHFEYSETGSVIGFLDSEQLLSPVAIGTNGESSVTMATLKKIANETKGEITVTLLEQPTYTISASDNEIAIAVQNELTPTISIESSKNGEIVEEGTNYTFTLTASPPPSTDLAVILVVASGNTGHFGGLLKANEETPITSTNSTVMISTSGVSTFSVLVNNVSASVEHGQIDISINTAPDKSYAIHQTASSISTSISDTVLPEISISSEFHNTQVIEGDEFSFRLVADPAPVTAVSVELDVQDSGVGHFLSLTNGNTVSIGSDGILEITEQITLVEANQSDGQIDISILASGSSDYTRSTNNRAIQITILDSTPVVSIKSVINNQSIQEGDSFAITLEAYPLTNSLVVALSYTNQSSHFASFSTGNYVTINANSDDLRGVREVTVNTRVLSNSDNGVISLRVGSSAHALYKLSTTHNLVTVDVKDSTLPTVSISSASNGTSVTEGSSFTFTLTSDPIQTGSLDIEISVIASDTDHLGLLTIENPSTTTITGNTVSLGTTGSRVVSVATNNVTARAEHGKIMIAVVSRSTSSYVVSPTAGEIEVKIKDASKPVVKISSSKNGGYINEGGRFDITLTAIPTPESPIFVRLTAEDGGSQHFKSMSENLPIQIGVDGVKTVTVSTFRVPAVQRGEIIISLDSVNSNDDYTLSTEQAEQSIRVLVRDSVTPVVSIQPPSNVTSITEGESFNFSLVSTPAPVSPISIELNISDGGSGHFSNISVANPVVIDETGTTTVTVNTTFVSTAQRHGSIGILITTKSGREC